MIVLICRLYSQRSTRHTLCVGERDDSRRDQDHIFTGRFRLFRISSTRPNPNLVVQTYYPRPVDQADKQRARKVVVMLKTSVCSMLSTKTCCRVQKIAKCFNSAEDEQPHVAHEKMTQVDCDTNDKFLAAIGSA